MKNLKKKLLSTSVSAGMTLAICSSIPVSLASDIEIYSDAQKGQTSILLMLDTSGSMGISSLVLPRTNQYGSPGDVDSSLCEEKEVEEANIKFKEWTYNLKSNISYAFRLIGANEIVDVSKRYQQHNSHLGNRISYDGKYYSQSNTGNYVKVDVLPNTAKALTEERTAIRKEVTIGNEVIPYYIRGCTNNVVTQYDRLSRLKDAVIQLLANNSLDDNVKIGLGHFSTKTEINVGTTKNKLVDGHSGRILVPVAKLSQEQRKRLVRELAAIESVDTQSRGDGTPSLTDLKLTSENYPNIFKAASGTPTAHAYAEAAAYMMGTTTGIYPRTLPTKTSILYDGYAVIKNNRSGHADYKKQLYYVCVGLDGKSSSALGATAMFCDNQWNRGIDGSYPGQFFQNSAPGPLVVIYKPNGNGGWTQVSPGNYKTEQAVIDHLKNQGMTTSNITDVWTLHKSLPVGWRWGGWLKVEHEPMDIEPIGAKVWDHHGSDTKNLVSYRSSPFSLESIDKVPVDNMVGGFAYSANDTKNTTTGKYIAGGSTNQCDGNGIYFLTDGAPNSTKDTMAQAIMNLSLGQASYQFLNKPTSNTLSSPRLQASVFEGETGGWEYIGAYAKKIRDKTQNPGNMLIKTAVVGFGSSFAGIPKNTDGSYNCEAVRSTNLDAYNACKWGGSEFGDGGFYYAENSDDIKQSIIEFVKKTEVNIEPVVTGNPTIPIDALNPTELQEEAYYATFEPKVSSVSQLWAGNLNKYSIKNGELLSANGSQRLITTNGAVNKDALGFWAGGTLGQLGTGADFSTFLTDGKIITNRKVYTNRQMTGAVASSGAELQVVDVDALFGGNFDQDVDKNYWLNVLGFNVGSTQAGITKANLNTFISDKKLGAVMHSTPVLLTQEGKVSSTGGALTTSDRKDYLMYGSTQGVLHVVDVKTGKEVFGFLPHEMMEKQKNALLLRDQTAGGTSNLFYGIDAPWVAHTQYTTTSNGLLTVKDSDRTVNDESGGFLKGHQWVYGGLRMGGKSYYALDLSDIAVPKMMFHINPTSQDSPQPLKRMGQSWSKPTLAQVNWGGQRKLVMFVGGGYDAEGLVQCASNSALNNKGYECPTYVQTNKIGAGVYMFDAQNGELLWWSSADNNATPADSSIRFTQNSDLKYSVVSQINAVDRNADGLVDHLYFGDLAGQTFRVDLNNALNVSATLIANDAKNNFAKRTVTLFSEHNATGRSPRFYEMPSFSVHVSENTGQRFAAVAFSSGNRSTPLADSTQSAKDGVFVVYDNDVGARDLFSDSYVLKTSNAQALQETDLSQKVPHTMDTSFKAGWKHFFSNTQGAFKGMNNLYALDGMLYVNVYHKDGVGIAGNCGGGVKGDSYLFQYCLPYGKCDFEVAGVNGVNRVKLGAGILGTGVGKGYGNKDNTLSLVVNRDDPKPVDCKLPANKNLPQCQLFDNSVRLKQLRWYESR